MRNKFDNKKDLSGHDEASCGRVDGDVASHEADVVELVKELAVLLIAQGLNGARVDDALAVAQRARDRVLGDGSFACRRVRREQHRLRVLHTEDGLALERVEHERVLLGWSAVRDH